MNMKIDLCSRFKNSTIEGIEKHDLLDAIDGKSKVFMFQDDQSLIHAPSGKRIVLGCAYAYFEPVQSYYKPGKTSSCSYVQRAMGADAGDHDCVRCIASCIRKGLAIKPKKLVISRDYYKK